jgi:hypothetical protein
MSRFHLDAGRSRTHLKLPREFNTFDVQPYGSVTYAVTQTSSLLQATTYHLKYMFDYYCKVDIIMKRTMEMNCEFLPYTNSSCTMS